MPVAVSVSLAPAQIEPVPVEVIPAVSGVFTVTEVVDDVALHPCLLYQ